MAWIARRGAAYVRVSRIRGYAYLRGYDYMHHKLVRTSARTAVIGAVIVLGSTAAAQGAMAGPTGAAIVSVPCNPTALASAIGNASSGQKLLLAFGCTYVLGAALPDIGTNLTIVGYGASLERSGADDTPDFTILTVKSGDLNLIGVNFYDGGDGIGSDDIGDAFAGAIVNDGGNVSVLGGTFGGNASSEYGGAIYNEDGTLAMTSAYFVYNGSDDFGGAIYNEGTMTLRSTHFLYNYGTDGAAIYNDGTATVIGTTFTEGDGTDGGALYNDGVATLSSVTMQNNSANYGGGIYNDETLTVASSNIVHNYADTDGGGIYNDDDESVTLSRTKVTGNVPDNCGPLSTIAGCTG
jgi:predicted outer membrane repeat protein